MTVYNWLCLAGIPALLALAAKILYSSIKAIRNGVQALLRAQLISDYNRYVDKGYAPLYARENFENCYQQYHALGKNGVMDDMRRRFLELPTEGGNENEN